MSDINLYFDPTDDETGYIVSHLDEVERLEIPAVYNGKPVVAIDDNAFDSSPDLAFVRIPATVKRIGENAFAWCGKLKTVEMENGVTHIGADAFACCDALTAIEIPASVVEIDGAILNGCNGLTSIAVEAGNGRYRSIGNCLIDTSTKTLISGCKASVIPDDGSVTEIAEDAFCGIETLTRIDIPDTVTHIGKRAFNSCIALRALHIPHSVTEIDGDLCGACDSLTELTVDPKNPIYHSRNNCIIDTRNKRLIAGCNDSVIPDDGSVAIIASGAFEGELRPIRTLRIPQSVCEIESEAFCGLDELASIVVARDNRYFRSEGDCLIRSSDEHLILGCSQSRIPDDVRSIGENAFFACTFTRIALPRRLQRIDKCAFRSCEQMRETVVPEGVTQIGEWAFYGCNRLERIVLPETLTQIDNFAFGGCKALAEIVYNGNKKQWKAIKKHPDWFLGAKLPCTLIGKGLFGKRKTLGTLTDSPFCRFK